MPFWVEVIVQYLLPIGSFITAIVIYLYKVMFSPSNKIEVSMHNLLFKLFHKNLDVEKIKEKINDLKLCLGNDDCLSLQSFVEINRYVYFPVVPRPNLSVIHLVFLRHINELQKLGLKVRVLVFDDYYRRKENIDKQNTKIHISNFVKALKLHGGNDLKLCFESKINKKKKTAKIVYNRALDLCSRFSIAEINEIREKTAPTTDSNKPYIMQQKIIYNMAHLSSNKNIGFVLCGQDEISLWKKFAEKEAMCSSAIPTTSQIVILGIPLMKNSDGQAMSMWSGNNLYSNISLESIKREIYHNISNVNNIQSNFGIFYLLDNLYFICSNNHIRLKTEQGEMIFSDIDSLIKYFKEKIHEQDQTLLQQQVNAMAEIVYNILHKK